MKRYIQIDENGYFLDFYSPDPNATPENTLSAWTETGGSAADGYETPIIPQEEIIPPNVIHVEPPLMKPEGRISKFKWIGYHWVYDYDE